MRNIIGLVAVTGLLVTLSFAQSQSMSKTKDEQALRKIESETADFEQQNDSSKMAALADDWVGLMNGNRKVMSKVEFEHNVKSNFATHDNGSSPYTIEKKNMRMDLFGDTAVVTYIKEYRQTADATKFFDEDDTDVFTRTYEGWRLRLTKITPAPSQPSSN